MPMIMTDDIKIVTLSKELEWKSKLLALRMNFCEIFE